MKFLSACAIFALTVSLSYSAAARPEDCAPYQVWRDALKERFGEVKVADGLSISRRIIVELFENPETHTFTLLTTDEQGTSCPLSGGTDWEPVKAEGEPS